MTNPGPLHNPRQVPVDLLPPLLSILHGRQHPTTIETLAKTLDSPAADVRRSLDKLVAAGCQIDSHPTQGVRLFESGLATWEDYLRWRLHCGSDRIIRVFRQTSSTQDAVRNIVKDYGQRGSDAVAVADEQTFGRGRLNKRWVTPPGSAIAFSRAFTPSGRYDPATQANWLTVATVVAVARAIESVTTLRPPTLSIKWPNDILLAEKKVAGILVESFELPQNAGRPTAIIGIGINTSLDPNDIKDECGDRPTTSLDSEGHQIDRLVLLAETLARLDKVLAEPDIESVTRQWRHRCPVGSDPVGFGHDGREIFGQVVDLDPLHGLIVRTASGELMHLPARTTSVLTDPTRPLGR